MDPALAIVTHVALAGLALVFAGLWRCAVSDKKFWQGEYRELAAYRSARQTLNEVEE